MTQHARPQGPIQGTARYGFDRPYAEKRADAERELKSTLLGRDRPYGVPRDDTGMKNPDGDLSAPSARPVKRQMKHQ
jgi:hypothetical protein